MLGIRYVKSAPTTHVIHYRNGRVVRQGAGLSFFCFAPNSTIVQIPLASADLPFVFEEVTADFQDVTIQGDLTFRVIEPERLASVLDYSVNHIGRNTSDDPTRLNDRLVHQAKTSARIYTQKHGLNQLLIQTDELVQHLRDDLRASEVVTLLGIEVMGVTVQSIKPTPEMGRALQAEAREKLLLKSDEAVFARRNTAIELERTIKENELNTEIAIEQKQREVRVAKLNADVALEAQRAELVDRRVINDAKENESRAQALQMMLTPLKDVDWRTLLAAQPGGLDSGQMIAMAFRDLADNADKLGMLNISPDLLQTLLHHGSKPDASPAAREQRNR